MLLPCIKTLIFYSLFHLAYGTIAHEKKLSTNNDIAQTELYPNITAARSTDISHNIESGQYYNHTQPTRRDVSQPLNQCRPPFLDAYFWRSACLSSRHYQVICGDLGTPIIKPPVTYQGFCAPSQLCVSTTTKIGLQIAYCIDAERYKMDYIDPPSTKTSHRPETTHNRPAQHITKRDDSTPLNQCQPPFRIARFRRSRCLSRTHYEVMCRSIPENAHLTYHGLCLPSRVCVDTITSKGLHLAHCVKQNNYVATNSFTRSDSLEVAPSDHAPRITKRDVPTPLNRCLPPFRSARFVHSQCRSRTVYRVVCESAPGQEPHLTYEGICPRFEVCVDTTTDKAVYLAYCVSAMDYVATHSINPSNSPSLSHGLGIHNGPHVMKRERDSSIPLNQCQPPYRVARFYRSVCLSRKNYEVTCRRVMAEYVAGQNPYLTYDGNCLPSQVCVDRITRLGIQLAYCVEEKSHGVTHNIDSSPDSNITPSRYIPNVTKRDISTTQHLVLHIIKREPSTLLDQCPHPYREGLIWGTSCLSTRTYQITCWIMERDGSVELRTFHGSCPSTHICVDDVRGHYVQIASCVNTQNFMDEKFMRYAKALIANSNGE